MKNVKGKFIVIDGTDGSGKGTQTKILIFQDSLKLSCLFSHSYVSEVS